jgi:hypothetical protein
MSARVGSPSVGRDAVLLPSCDCDVGDDDDDDNDDDRNDIVHYVIDAPPKTMKPVILRTSSKRVQTSSLIIDLFPFTSMQPRLPRCPQLAARPSYLQLSEVSLPGKRYVALVAAVGERPRLWNTGDMCPSVRVRVVRTNA